MSSFDIFTITVFVREHNAECEFSYNTPALLADKIKELVKDYYKED